MKLVSFAVPCYNSAEYMDRCIESLLKGGEEVEIIQESKIDSIIPKGASVYLEVKTEKINIFTEDGSRDIVAGVKNDLDIYRKG